MTADRVGRTLTAEDPEPRAGSVVLDRGMPIQRGDDGKWWPPAFIRNAKPENWQEVAVNDCVLLYEPPEPVTPVPIEPGTRFTATVRGLPNRTVMVLARNESFPYCSAEETAGTHWHLASNITNVSNVEPPATGGAK